MRITMYATLVVFGCVIGTAAPCQGQPGDVINEEVKLVPSDGAFDDRFGISVAIDRGVVAVGSYMDDDHGDYSGSAYLFDATTGEELFKLLPSDGVTGGQFGWSISIDRGVVAVGASGDSDNGRYAGSAYLFDAATGTQIAKLLPNDGAKNDGFGYSIAVDNGVVAIGARGDDDNGDESGSVYLFEVSTGTQIGKLLANDGVEDDLFGSSIAIDNGVVAVGAPGYEPFGNDYGSAYLFDVITGVQLAKFLPGDGTKDDRFGDAISIDGDFVAVGAWKADDHGESSGSVYLFSVSTGEQIAKILPEDGAEEDFFGWAIAIDDGIVAVGATGDADNQNRSGSAYLFDAFTGEQILKLLPSDGEANERFGSSIAIKNGAVAGGARYGGDSGSAYVFDASARCLDLTIENLVSGQRAVFTIKQGRPGAKVITVYGTEPGRTTVRDYFDYCATFGIDTNQDKIIDKLKRRFDTNGEVRVELDVPANLAGRYFLFQSAQQGTCPEECFSNLVEITVQ